jgi:hypothetical protein
MVSTMQFQTELTTLFYDQMDRQTSAYLYGSAATGSWVAARSDLDLLIFVPENKLALLGEKIKVWSSNPGHPILDGFALFFSQGVPMAKRLEEFHLQARPAVGEIQVIDFWNMKYRSKHLFGEDLVQGFPEISLSQLSGWARKELQKAFGSSHSGEVPKADVVLSKLIWSVSWSARMLMLAKGIVCDSKQEALKWLAQNHPEIREPIRLILDDFSKSDAEPTAITADQDFALRKFCFELMRLEVKAQGKLEVD